MRHELRVYAEDEGGGYEHYYEPDVHLDVGPVVFFAHDDGGAYDCSRHVWCGVLCGCEVGWSAEDRMDSGEEVVVRKSRMSSRMRLRS